MAGLTAAPVTLDRRKLAELLEGRDGPVARDLMRRATRVESLAKRGAPVNTGRLRSSIRTELGRDSHGVYAWVGTDVTYALFVHEGTDRHVIVPRSASVLHFKIDGQDVFALRVDHPGTKAQPFLRDALRAAA